MENEYQANPFIKRCLLQINDEHITHRSVDIDLQIISREIYNPLRYGEISVIVVDYAMPQSNGLDFARRAKAKNPHFKILMLTGEADEATAIKAFNEGIIDLFIRKDAADFEQLINASINTLQHRYFQELSQPIMGGLTAYPKSIACFYDSRFIQFFNRICEENHITEYYLTDTYGGFLLLNFEGVPTLLAIRDEEGMEDNYQISSFSDQSFPQPLLQDLKNRDKMLVLFQECICDDPVQAQKYIVPSYKFSGSHLYYYSLVENLRDYPISAEKIFSCRAYLDETPL